MRIIVQWQNIIISPLSILLLPLLLPLHHLYHYHQRGDGNDDYYDRDYDPEYLPYFYSGCLWMQARRRSMNHCEIFFVLAVLFVFISANANVIKYWCGGVGVGRI